MEANQKRGPAVKATESEMHVSARCITHPEAMADVIAEGVTPEDFAEPTPSLVMGVAWDLFNRSELTSHEVVKSELQQRERFDEIGWEAWSDFVSFGWGEEDLPYHARRVRQAARLRRKDKAMRDGSDGIRGSGSLRQREDRADDAMERLVRERADQAESVQHGADMAAQLQQRLEREEAEEIRLPTGIYSFDKRFRGVPRSRVTVIGARTSHGKAQPLDEPVLTPEGWVEMGELEVGAQVIGSDGCPTEVTGVYPQGEKQIYRVEFYDGTFVRCCGEHLWHTTTASERKSAQASRRKGTARSTEEIAETLTRWGRKNHMVPRHAPIEGKKKALPVDPYVLGALIGDGSLSSGSVAISCPDKYVTNRVSRSVTANMFEKKGSSCEFWLTTPRGQPNELYASMKELGLMGKRAEGKFIPPEYFTASYDQRLALMRGLMDTDGTPNTTKSSVFYSTVSEQLCHDVVELARGLGCRATFSSRFTHYTYKGEKKRGQKSYRIHVTPYGGDLLFALPRKRDKTCLPKRTADNAIIAVVPDGKAECQCISVDAVDSLYVTRGHNLTHNTLAADMIGIACARRFKRQAKEGEPARQVVKFDLENSALEAQPRLLAGVASTRGEKLTTQTIEDHLQNIQPMTGPQMERASAGNAELKELPLVLDTEGQGSPAYIRARLLAEKARAPIGLVIVDYMELVEGEGRGKVEQVMNAMRELHFIARDMEVPVILLSQTNRNQTNRDNGEPHLSDLSWGDALAKYSKMVIMPFNPFVHWQQTGQQGIEPPEDAFDLWVRKNKGEQGLCSLKIDPDVPMLYDPNEPQETWPSSGGASSAPVPSGDTPF